MVTCQLPDHKAFLQTPLLGTDLSGMLRYSVDICPVTFLECLLPLSVGWPCRSQNTEGGAEGKSVISEQISGLTIGG